MPMTEDEFFTALGRKQLALETLQQRYDLTLLELSRVKSGEIDPQRLTINLADGSWSRTALPETSPVPSDPVQPV